MCIAQSVCGHSLRRTSSLPGRLRLCHSDLFISDDITWRTVYSGAVRNAFEREGVEESEIASELMISYECEKVPLTSKNGLFNKTGKLSH